MLQVLGSMSREQHACGGWGIWQKNPIPSSSTAESQYRMSDTESIQSKSICMVFRNVKVTIKTNRKWKAAVSGEQAVGKKELVRCLLLSIKILA